MGILEEGTSGRPALLPIPSHRALRTHWKEGHRSYLPSEDAAQGGRDLAMGFWVSTMASAPQLGGPVCCHKYRLESLVKYTDSGTVILGVSISLLLATKAFFTYVADTERKA